MDLTIYAVDGKAVADALETAAMVMGSDSFRLIMSIAATLGFMGIVFKHIAGMKARGEGRSFFVVYLLLLVLVFPTTDVIVRDKIRGSQYPVANVPVGWAVSTSIITTLSHNLEKMTAVARSQPGAAIDPLSPDKGVFTPLQYMYLLRNIVMEPVAVSKSEQLARVNRTLNYYLVDCYLPMHERVSDNAIANKIVYADDFWSSMKVDHPAYYSRTVLNTPSADDPPERKLCSDVYQDLTNAFQKPEFINGLVDYLIQKAKEGETLSDPSETAKSVYGQGVSQGQVRSFFLDVINALFTGSGTPLTFVPNSDGSGYTIVDPYDANNGGVSEAGMFSNIAQRLMFKLYLVQAVNHAMDGYMARSIRTNPWKATLLDGYIKQGLSFMTAGWGFRNYSVSAIGFIEAFVYSILPVAILMLLIAGFSGLRLVGMYLLTILWVNMWPYSYTLLHSMVVQQFMDVISKLDTLGNFEAINTLLVKAHNLLGMGGWMIALIPVLTLFLLKGAIYVWNTMATQLMGKEKINEDNLHRDTFGSEPVYSFDGMNAKASPHTFMASQGAGYVAQPGFENLPNTMMQLSNTIGHGVSSAKSYAETAEAGWNSAVSKTLNHALSSGENLTSNYGLRLADANRIMQDHSASRSTAEKIVENQTYGLSSDQQRYVALGATLQAAAKAGVDVSAALDKLPLSPGVKAGIEALAKGDMQNAGKALNIDSSKLDMVKAAMDDVQRNDQFAASMAQEGSWSFDKSAITSTGSQDQVAYTDQLGESYAKKVQAAEQLTALSQAQRAVNVVASTDQGTILSRVAEDRQALQNLNAYLDEHGLKDQVNSLRHNDEFYQAHEASQYGNLRGEDAVDLAAKFKTAAEYAIQSGEYQEFVNGVVTPAVDDLIPNAKDSTQHADQSVADRDLGANITGDQQSNLDHVRSNTGNLGSAEHQKAMEEAEKQAAQAQQAEQKQAAAQKQAEALKGEVEWRTGDNLGVAHATDQQMQDKVDSALGEFQRQQKESELGQKGEQLEQRLEGLRERLFQDAGFAPFESPIIRELEEAAQKYGAKDSVDKERAEVYLAAQEFEEAKREYEQKFHDGTLTAQDDIEFAKSMAHLASEIADVKLDKDPSELDDFRQKYLMVMQGALGMGAEWPIFMMKYMAGAVKPDFESVSAVYGEMVSADPQLKAAVEAYRDGDSDVATKQMFLEKHADEFAQEHGAISDFWKLSTVEQGDWLRGHDSEFANLYAQKAAEMGLDGRTEESRAKIYEAVFDEYGDKINSEAMDKFEALQIGLVRMNVEYQNNPQEYVEALDYLAEIGAVSSDEVQRVKEGTFKDLVDLLRNTPELGIESFTPEALTKALDQLREAKAEYESSKSNLDEPWYKLWGGLSKDEVKDPSSVIWRSISDSTVDNLPIQEYLGTRLYDDYMSNKLTDEQAQPVKGWVGMSFREKLDAMIERVPELKEVAERATPEEKVHPTVMGRRNEENTHASAEHRRELAHRAVLRHLIEKYQPEDWKK